MIGKQYLGKISLALLVGVLLGYCISFYSKNICKFFEKGKNQNYLRHPETFSGKDKQGHELGEKHFQEAQLIQLTPGQVRQFGIETVKVTKRHFQEHLTLSGHVALNENAIAHVVASVPGMVKEIYKGLGDVTKPGEPLASLQSRDMAEGKSTYISAAKVLTLKEDIYDREEKLWKQGIIAEAQFIQTRHSYENAKVDVEQKKQKLLALGMKEEQIQALSTQKTPLNIYTIDAPIAGEVIERHITLGEVIFADKQIFVIADMDTVWIELAVPAQDLSKVKKGQKVNLSAQQGPMAQAGEILYVSPIINEEGRMGKAIIEIDNLARSWHPGDFVTAQVVTSDHPSFLSLPQPAIQQINEKPYVFVKVREGVFQARLIQIKGSVTGELIEVLGGIQEGEELVLTNTFLLKAELGKNEAGHSH